MFLFDYDINTDAFMEPSFISFPFGFLSAFAEEVLIKITVMQKQKTSRRKPASATRAFCHLSLRPHPFISFVCIIICASQVFIRTSRSRPL
jgi:hypothetical protein